MMRFGLLGTVAVDCGGKSASVRWPMPRSVLAALLLNANRVVSAGRLIDVLWGDEPPASAVGSLQNHVMRLRALLAGGGAGRIRTVAPGYLIEVADGDVDLNEFIRLSRCGREARDAGDWEAATRALTDALGLWRGDPLADVTSRLLREREVPRLVQMRLEAWEARVDASLQLGRHAEVIAELAGLTGAYPLRERLHAQLMLAYHQTGRQAEALSAYRRAREILAEELGVEPGPELRQLHQRILAGDPGPAIVTRRPAIIQPAQLPADLGDFTGRADQVMLLTELAGRAGQHPGVVPVCVVTGPGGIGKTALAVHVAHQLAQAFPGGPLHASLQGATSAVNPGDVLARFLRDLGVPDSAIPADEAGRAARYRSVLAGRRVLVVLDDAQNAAQVRSLLPGSATCAVIITSRRTLADLAGAVPLGLDVLDPDEARALFTRIAGPERVAAEPDAAQLVLGYCAGLPLAIRIAAARLASRPAWSIAFLAARLSDECGRLGELAAGDLAVRASLAVSYRALPAGDLQEAGVFRLLGLAGIATISLPAVAALADGPADEIARSLEALIDAHCLETDGAASYRMHDLLRIYAAELAEHADSPEQRRSAIRRLLEWYRQRAVASGGWYGSAYIPPGTDAVQIFTSAQEALGWCEAERVNLIAMVRRAAELEMPDVAAQIAAGLWWFFQRRPYQDDWLATHEIGLVCARLAGDAYTEGWLLNSLGKLHCRAGRFDDAHRCLKAALAIWQRTGGREGEVKVLNTLGASCLAAGRIEAGIAHLSQSLAIASELGEAADIAIACNNLGEGYRQLKRYDEAFASLRRALALFQHAGDRYGEAIAETTIGEVYADRGQLDMAIAHHERALAANDNCGPEAVERAGILCSLAQAYSSLSRAAEATDAWLGALTILDRFGDPAADDIRHRLAAHAGA
jgi:DNA-binding SARP family transcriptional activator